MRCLISLLLVLATGSLASASDEIPRRVLLDQSEYVGRQAKLFEDIYYLWLHVRQLDRERAEWRFGFDEVQDVTLTAMEILAEFARDEDSLDEDSLDEDSLDEDSLDEDSFLAGLIQPGSARAYGLKDGQRIPPARFAEICKAASFDRSANALLDRPPERFDGHIEEARGAILGRVTRIEHGFFGPIASLLLELDVEDTLIPSDYSPHPYLVVATSGYVHEDTVYCSWPAMRGWLPAVGQRLIAMPVTGPWEKDGEIMPIVDPVELFLVGEPDNAGVSKVTPLLERKSVPKTLLEFRHRLWEARDQLTPDGS